MAVDAEHDVVLAELLEAQRVHASDRALSLATIVKATSPRSAVCFCHLCRLRLWPLDSDSVTSPELETFGELLRHDGAL